jgi:voltage-gated potassium channel
VTNATNANGDSHPLRSKLRELYFGTTPSALRFQAVLVALDVVIIGFFIVTQFVRDWPILFYTLDFLVAAFVLADLTAKWFALGSLKRLFKYPTTWVDLVVLATLLVPAMHNWGFLRILRLWTLVQRERFWNVIGGGKWDDTYVEDLTKAIVNLVVFVFLAAGVAQAIFLEQHPKLNNFLDAVYFVVTLLSTTGLGDITIDTWQGRVFSIMLMVTGVTLFFSIAQKAFAGRRRSIVCDSCGLDRHEADAAFCRSCGARLDHTASRRRPRLHHHNRH